MKRIYNIGIPLLAFGLAAGAGWVVESLSSEEGQDSQVVFLSPRKRAASVMKSEYNKGSISSLERRIKRYDPAPPRKHYDAKGMDDAISMQGTTFVGSCWGGSHGFDYASDWARDAPEEMFQWLVEQGEERSYYAHVLFERWADVDTQRAYSASLAIPDQAVKAQAIMTVLNRMAADDPESALRLLELHQALYAPDKPMPAFNDDEHPEACLKLVDGLPKGETRTHLLHGMLESMNHEEIATGYWSRLSDLEKKELVDAGLGFNYISSPELYQSLERLVRERVEKTNDPELAESFISNHGVAWAKRDLSGALVWVQGHMRGSDRRDAYNVLFWNAAQHDLDQTVAVWKSLPAGHLKLELATRIEQAAPDKDKDRASALMNGQVD